jgi:hypothetical protein
MLVTAQSAFVDALSVTSLIGAGFAVVGSIVALVWLPSQPAADREVIEPAEVVATGAAAEISPTVA